MSTLKVNSIKSPSSSTGGIEIDSSGAITGALPYPNRNLLYNGAMQVAQRGTSATGITTSGYQTVDRWIPMVDNIGTYTMSVENDAPTGSGFRKSAKMLCTTADAAPAAGDFLILRQYLEGQDLQRIAKGTASAQQLTISFWVKSNVTGTYIVELEDNDNTRTVSKSYSVSASGTWEYKTLTFPADTTGAFDNDNAKSLTVDFWLAAGSTFSSGTLNTSWAANTNANRAVGQTNLAAATNNYWQVTGVQLEVGDTATEFEHLPFGVELARCQRYYWRNSASGNYTALSGYGNANSTTNARTHAAFPVSMRVAPTSVEYKNVAAYDGVTILAVTSAGLSQSSSNGSQVDWGVSGATQYRSYIAISNNTTDSYLAFNAEL